MAVNDEYTLHRKRPGSVSDKMVVSGSKEDLLRQYLNVPSGDRSQYSLMQGGMVFNHLEMEAMAREVGSKNDLTEE